MSELISILLVDDHTMVRETVARQLDAQPGMKVVGTVANAADAVVEARRLKPRIILMDIDMPGMACFEAVGIIRECSPESRVIFLSSFFHDRYINQAITVRGWGYIVKTETMETVVAAIRKVVSGGTYFSPEVRARLVVEGRVLRLAHKNPSRISTLTEREIQIVRHLARGMPHKEIARTMDISVHTVHRHVTNVMEKIGIHDRVELARYAIREGLAEA